MQSSSPETHRPRHSLDLKQYAAWVLLAGLFLIAFYRTAWVSEDAFITFRVIDNSLNGFGLTWNPGERVQAYTHPLWFGLLLPLTAILRDPYDASIWLSLTMLAVTLFFIGRTFGRWRLMSAIATAALLWSQAFMDYASSGLENPLTHALLAVYLYAWLRQEDFRFRTATLATLTSALYLTRPDAVMLVGPILLFHCWVQRANWKTTLRQALAGFLPIIVWTAFSVFYYGTPVPNTAIAKVGTGLSIADRAAKAWNYLIWSLDRDQVTIYLLLAAIGLGLISRHRMLRPVALGILAWLLYLVVVGADYMGGRFFSGAVVLAVVVVGLVLVEQARIAIGASVLVLLINIQALGATLFSPINYHEPVISSAGIANERGYYYPALGLAPTLARGGWFVHPWLMQGHFLSKNPGTYTRCTIGMVAFAGGSQIRWIDPYALTEPFLARLPSRTGARVGHYERAFPEGFLNSVVQNHNLIVDPVLRDLYADVQLATRAPLFSTGRLEAIWRLNMAQGRLAEAKFDREAIGLPGVEVTDRSMFSCYGLPDGNGSAWKIQGTPLQVLRVNFGG